MFLKILKYSSLPPTVIFPIPLVPVIVGLFAGDLSTIWKPLVLTFLFYPGINLWNHLNDAEDDQKAGRDTPFITKRVREITVFIIFSLFFISACFIFIFGNRTGLIFYFIVLILIFLYSDNIFTKIRLKRHYVGELIVYFVSVPSYILMLYSTISNIDKTAVELTLVLTPLLVSTLFTKDLKDISADKIAGLKTLGVVFNPKSLLKMFLGLVCMYFLIGTIIFKQSLILVSFLPAIGTIYAIYKFHNARWEITEFTIKYYNLTLLSGLTSLSLLILLEIIVKILG